MLVRFLAVGSCSRLLNCQSNLQFTTIIFKTFLMTISSLILFSDWKSDYKVVPSLGADLTPSFFSLAESCPTLGGCSLLPQTVQKANSSFRVIHRKTVRSNAPWMFMKHLARRKLLSKAGISFFQHAVLRSKIWGCRFSLFFHLRPPNFAHHSFSANWNRINRVELTPCRLGCRISENGVSVIVHCFVS